MNIGLSYINQFRGAQSARALGGWVAQTLNQLVASITASYGVEHNANDTHGTIHCDAISERGRSVAMGVWTTVPFNPSDFGTLNNVTTWTVASTDVLRFAYTLVGKTMTVAFTIAHSSVAAGTASSLTIRIPGGYRSAAITANAVGYANNNGARILSAASVLTSDPLIYLDANGGNWAASVTGTYVYGEMSFEVQ